MNAPNVARNFRAGAYERDADDWYVEPRFCVEQLADAINFDGAWVWDPACGGGNVLRVFADRGHQVIGSDIVDRGSEHFAGLHDFLSDGCPTFVPTGARLSIAMNPPFKLAAEFVRKAIALTDYRVAILQQLSFLASRQRHVLFTEFPPSDVLILSQRPSMPPGRAIEEMGDRAFKGGTTDFCWIVWTRPHDRETRVRWLLPKVAA